MDNFKNIGIELCKELSLNHLEKDLSRGKTTKDFLIEDEGVEIMVPTGSLVEFFPPITITFTSSPDFKIHIDISPKVVERVFENPNKANGKTRRENTKEVNAVKICWK